MSDRDAALDLAAVIERDGQPRRLAGDAAEMIRDMVGLIDRLRQRFERVGRLLIGGHRSEALGEIMRELEGDEHD